MSGNSSTPDPSSPPGADEALSRLARRLGPGARCFFSPGRVNLMGAHLDYNGGSVMPTAIDRGTFLGLGRLSERVLRLSSGVEPGSLEVPLDELPAAPAGRWWDYPLGVLRQFELGALDGGLELVLEGNLAIGAGLSSSASICVGTAFASDALLGTGLGPEGLVERALSAEREFVGVQCGIMDPFAVGHSRPGHLLHLDCADRTIEHLPLDPTRFRIAVADTGVRRELAAGAFNERVEQCAQLTELFRADVPAARFLRDVPFEVYEQRRRSLSPVLARRAAHVFSELARTQQARAALLEGRVDVFGAAMTESQASLGRNYEVSTPELDLLVDAAVAVPGVLGSRLTGAGFGGCTVILLERGAEAELMQRLDRAYKSKFGRLPRIDFYAGDPGPRELPV